MKKSFYLTGLAALALVGCTSNEDSLSSEELANLGSEEITFSASKGVTTRATSVGSDAASKLNNHFVVYGTKHTKIEDGTADNDVCVYNQYNVVYGANTAGSTQSNTNNWDYVGKANYLSASTNQTIHYWDYSANNGYTFYAFSSSNISYPADETNDLVYVTKTLDGTDVYKKGYSVTVKNGAALDNLYFSERTPVAKTFYGKPVTLAFRNMTAKVRVGFYETIPGYSVKIDKFYYNTETDRTKPITSYIDLGTADETYFEAGLQNVNKDADENRFTVTYNDDTNKSVENRATVAGGNYQINLKLGSGIQSAETIGTASNACTWDETDGAYTTVFPIEGNSNPMFIRCDYTLIPLDGGKDTIHVTNARASVPVEYCKWKSNTAYTYIFKISDKTNGTTGSGSDKEGLYPVTFDAYVVATEDADMAEQQTITSVTTNSITTYQEGKVVDANDEYIPGDIYCVNKNNSDASIITPSAIATSTSMSAKDAIICSVTTSGDAISEATVLAKLNGMPNGIVLTPETSVFSATAPKADGTEYSFGSNGSVKFTASKPVYAYIYCKTPYVAATYEAAGTYSSGEIYYMCTSDGVYYAASGITEDNYSTYKSQLYTLKSPCTSGEYDIKVIKIVANSIKTTTEKGDGARAKQGNVQF